MTNNQECHLSMGLTVRDYLSPYASITTTLPGFSANSTLCFNTINQIQVVTEQQRISKKGITADKNKLKEILIPMAADYSRRLVAYATSTGNLTLLAEINIKESKMRQVADTAVKDYAQILYDRAQPILASLTTYSITALTQTAFLAAINAYNSSIGKPGAGRSEGRKVTKQLASLFKILDGALKSMDTIVEIIRTSQVDFYNGYKASRKIVKTGTGSLMLKLIVSDSNTHKHLNVVSVELIDSNGSLVFNKTAEKGGVNVKNLETGNYTLNLRKAGYIEHSSIVSLNKGELTVLNIAMDIEVF